MIRFGLSLAILLAAATTASASYCAIYTSGVRTCGIATHRACLEAVRGVGGICGDDYSGYLAPNLIDIMRAPDPVRRPGKPSGDVMTSPCLTLTGNTCSNNLH